MSLTRKTILRKAHKNCARPHLRRNFGLLVWHTGCAMRAHAYLQNMHTLQKFEELDQLHTQMEEINDGIDAKWEEIDAKRKVIDAKWKEIDVMHKEIIANVEAHKSRAKEYKDREKRKRPTYLDEFTDGVLRKGELLDIDIATRTIN